MRGRVIATASAAVALAGLLAAPAGADDNATPKAWPSPGKHETGGSPGPITGEPGTLQTKRESLVLIGQGEEKGGPSFTFPDELFDTDSATLTNSASADVKKVAQQLKKAGVTGDVNVVGHTDNTGSTKHNLKLSKQRAQSVADALKPRLQNTGIKFHVSGVGEKGALVKNDTAAHKHKNRRVAVLYKSGDSSSSSNSEDFSVPITQAAPSGSGYGNKPQGSIASTQKTVKLGDDGTWTLRVDVMELKRENKLLRLLLRLKAVSGPNNTDASYHEQYVFSGNADVDSSDFNAVLFDRKAGQQLDHVFTGKGDCMCDAGGSQDTFGPGQTQSVYAYYPMPTSKAKKLSLYLPVFGTISNLKIR